MVRQDTLPMFYGNHGFLFTLFDRAVDSASIFKWVRTIGAENVGWLRKVSLVVRSKDNAKYAEMELLQWLKRLGLRADEGSEVNVVRLKHPYCYCEFCIRTTIGEMPRERA